MRFVTSVKGYQTTHLEKSLFRFYAYRSFSDLHIRLVLFVKEPANGYYMHIDDPVKDFKKLNLKKPYPLFVPGDRCVTFHCLCSSGNGESISHRLFGKCQLRF